MPDGQLFQLPEKPQFPVVGLETASHWTKHLCLVGMGTHYQYGECQSGYQFTAFYDSADNLVGVINAINLETALTEIPDLIETVTSQDLLGLVLNASRFDPCFNLKQPRIFIHTYLRKPEVEYQSCDKDMEYTPNNNPTKRCNLCAAAMKSLVGAKCSGDPLSEECCCGISSLSNKAGGCRNQGCTLPSSCDGYDLGECTSDAHLVVATLSLLIISIFVLFWPVVVHHLFN